MLDIKYIRKYPEKVKEGCRKRGIEVDIDRLLEVDKEKTELKQELDKLREIQNKISQVISIEKQMEKLIIGISKEYFKKKIKI